MLLLAVLTFLLLPQPAVTLDVFVRSANGPIAGARVEAGSASGTTDTQAM